MKEKTSSNAPTDTELKKWQGSSVREKLVQLQSIFETTKDAKLHTIAIGSSHVSFFYLSSMAAEEKIYDEFIPKLINAGEKSIKSMLEAVDSANTGELQKVLSEIVSGKTAVFLNNEKQVYLITFRNKAKRSIEEPNSEHIIRGSHDGFIEDLESNMSILRYRIQNPDLTFEVMELGKKNKAKTAIAYLKTSYDPELLKEVKRRISYIDTEIMLTPGYLEEYIEDDPWSFFPQMLNSERPDRVISNLVDGRIALIMDGSPTVLIVPTTFFAFYQSTDDYNSRWISSTFIRLLRLASFIIAINLPAFYISIIGFHLEVIPQELIVQMKNSVEGIPYPPIFEAMLMELTIELIREAGVRLPSPISQTIGIVGGLVIGDAVVQAGLISNLMIVVVAVTAVSSYVVPSNEMSTTVRLLRFPLMIMASIFGFLGMTFGVIFILVKLCKLESFGRPYFAPAAPFNLQGLTDTFIRLPIWLKKEKSNKTGSGIFNKKKSSARGWEKNEN
ncbi:spore germination protein [Metabacillus sp. RGM 3146]|uniref:spore germination protein n=1 Tax=Metabacillus sp. RGM 3146 TaxID=3401092 RepID=UPI003B9C9319